MGNKVSSISGVRSNQLYKPGNGVNQIWVGDFEIVSRLPFGASDMSQASLSGKKYPSIPWRPFLIPLSASNQTTKRDLQSTTGAAATTSTTSSSTYPYPPTSYPAAAIPLLHGGRIDIFLWMLRQLPILLIALVPLILVIARSSNPYFPFSLFVRRFRYSRYHHPPSNQSHSDPSGRDIESVDEKPSRQHPPRLSPLLLRFLRACIGSLSVVVVSVHVLRNQGVINDTGDSPCTGRIITNAMQFPCLLRYDHTIGPSLRTHLYNTYSILMLCMLVLSWVAHGLLWGDVLIGLGVMSEPERAKVWPREAV